MRNPAKVVEILAQKLPPEMKLSEHFRVRELACSCCGRVYVTPVLMELLERLRDNLGCPLILDPPHGRGSGYRCISHNIAIGGASQSRHCLGLAVDIPLPMKYRNHPEEFTCIMELIAKQVGGGFHYYSASKFAHFDAWCWPKDRRW